MASGRGSRQKGARGEREFRDLLCASGFEARRDGRLDDDLVHNVEGFHFEVKRRETLAIPAWMRQARKDANGRIPVVAFRRNGEPWQVVIDAEAFLNLLKGE